MSPAMIFRDNGVSIVRWIARFSGLAPNDGSGGVIAIDAQGRIAMPFNCEGMYRGMVGHDTPLSTSIYR
jgi:isoaspartyl peptidase/L-asparaginase-like protein (Ntn-hydrolase superfamily)